MSDAPDLRFWIGFAPGVAAVLVFLALFLAGLRGDWMIGLLLAGPAWVVLFNNPHS